MSAYTSSKQIELGSTAFRQWRADHSHCRFIHGYQLKAKFTFGCNDLDNKGWCVDFGGLADLKHTLRSQFDHTTVVAGDDPELETFKTLNDKGVILLRIMPEGVGVEKFAEWVFKTADTYIEEISEGRCYVANVTVTEHDNNSASYTHNSYVEAAAAAATTSTETNTTPTPTPPVEVAPTPPEAVVAPKRGANVGNKVSRGKGNWFEGTTWG